MNGYLIFTSRPFYWWLNKENTNEDSFANVTNLIWVSTCMIGTHFAPIRNIHTSKWNNSYTIHFSKYVIYNWSIEIHDACLWMDQWKSIHIRLFQWYYYRLWRYKSLEWHTKNHMIHFGGFTNAWML